MARPALSWYPFHSWAVQVLCVVTAQVGGRCWTIHTVKMCFPLRAVVEPLPWPLLLLNRSLYAASSHQILVCVFDSWSLLFLGKINFLYHCPVIDVSMSLLAKVIYYLDSSRQLLKAISSIPKTQIIEISNKAIYVGFTIGYSYSSFPNSTSTFRLYVFI